MPVFSTKKGISLLSGNIFSDYFNNLVVIQQNIRSMRKNFDLFSIEVLSLSKRPDIIILTEIWIEDNELYQYCLPNYNLYSKTNHSYRSGGVAVFISSQFTCHVINDFDIETADCLHLALSISDSMPITLDIIAMYRLQEYNATDFTNDLEVFLSKNKSELLLICGDININTLDQTALVDSYNLVTSSYGLLPLITDPTRVSDMSCSCIDHMLIRCFQKIKIECVSWVVDAGITDHRMTVGCFKIDLIVTKNIYKKL
jgi:hypothetical protein